MTWTSWNSTPPESAFHPGARLNGALYQIGYGSLANPSMVVMEIYGKFGQGDVPGILAISTDDVMFDIQDLCSTPRPVSSRS